MSKLPETVARSMTCPIISGDGYTLKCVGSKCMSWRWEPHPPPQWREPEGFCRMIETGNAPSGEYAKPEGCMVGNATIIKP